MAKKRKGKGRDDNSAPVCAAPLCGRRHFITVSVMQPDGSTRPLCMPCWLEGVPRTLCPDSTDTASPQ